MLIAEEYTSPLWRYGFYLLLALSLLLFLLYLSYGDPVWGNTLRLGSFACFAGAVFFGLRLREGSYSVKLDREEDRVTVSYFKGPRQIDSELLETGGIDSFETAAAEGAARFLPGPAVVYILGRYSDRQEEQVHLFHFGGRPLQFDRDTGARIIRFLTTEEPHSNR